MTKKQSDRYPWTEPENKKATTPIDQGAEKVKITEKIPALKRLQDEADKRIAELRLRPPVHEYIDNYGIMKPVPSEKLESDHDVITMIISMREWTWKVRAIEPKWLWQEADPFDSYLSLYYHGCVTIDELISLLQRPIQIIQVHDLTYSPDLLVNSYPLARFKVEFVEYARFVSSINTSLNSSAPNAMRYSYCWPHFADKKNVKDAPRDCISESYESDLQSNQDFREAFKVLRESFPVSSWAFGVYGKWFAAFNHHNEVDQKLSNSFKGKAYIESFSTLCSFCNKWALTHIGCHHKEDSLGSRAVFRAERVEVVPRKFDNQMLLQSPTKSVDVYIPPYYTFGHIKEYSKNDFYYLNEAMNKVNFQRKKVTRLTASKKTKLLLRFKSLLIENRVKPVEVYRAIQTLVPSWSRPTFRKNGFNEPKVEPDVSLSAMERPELVAFAHLSVTSSASDYSEIMSILDQFGIDTETVRLEYAMSKR